MVFCFVLYLTMLSDNFFNSCISVENDEAQKNQQWFTDGGGGVSGWGGGEEVGWGSWSETQMWVWDIFI